MLKVLKKIGDNLKEISPTLMCTVPRLLEKLYDKIIAKGAELSGLKKILFFWALNLGLKHEMYGKNGLFYEFKLGIANKLIFNKWREAVGGKMKFIFVGLLPFSQGLQEYLLQLNYRFTKAMVFLKLHL